MPEIYDQESCIIAGDVGIVEEDYTGTAAGEDRVRPFAEAIAQYPAVILPNGIRGNDAPMPPTIDTGDDDTIGGPGTPVSLTFLGGHYQDAKLCAFARAYQQASGFEKLHPKLG